MVLRAVVGTDASSNTPSIPRTLQAAGAWVGAQSGGYFGPVECSRIAASLRPRSSMAGVANRSFVFDGQSPSVESVGDDARVDQHFCGLRDAIAVRLPSSDDGVVILAAQDVSWTVVLMPSVASLLLIWVPLVAHLTPTPKGFIDTLLKIPRVARRIKVSDEDDHPHHGTSPVVFNVCGF